MDSFLDILGNSFIAIHLVMFIVGLASNLILLTACFRSSPQKLKSYAIVLKFGTVNDLICVCCDFFVRQRVLIVPGNILYLSEGPCSHFSTRVCYQVYCMQLSTLVYSHYVMLTSFAYRLWILHHQTPRSRNVVLIMSAVCIPPLLIGFLFTFAQADYEIVLQFVHTHVPRYLNEEGALSGHSGMTLHLILTCLFVIAPIGPLYVCLIVIRQKILTKLDTTLSVISEKTRNMHKNFVKALTIHASLPLVTIVALIIYLTRLFELYYHPTLEKAIAMLASIPSALSAFCSLYYIEPYRRFVTCQSSVYTTAATHSLK